MKCLDSIFDDLGGEIDANIYVIDNASVDNLTALSQKFPHVILSKSRTNIGFAKAVNYYLSRTVSPYIMILNPDTIIKKGFFKSMMTGMEENPDVGIAGPKILESTGVVQGSARSFPTPMTGLFGRNAIMTKLFP